LKHTNIFDVAQDVRKRDMAPEVRKSGGMDEEVEEVGEEVKEVVGKLVAAVAFWEATAGPHHPLPPPVPPRAKRHSRIVVRLACGVPLVSQPNAVTVQRCIRGPQEAVVPLAKEADAKKESVKQHNTREKEMEGGVARAERSSDSLDASVLTSASSLLQNSWNSFNSSVTGGSSGGVGAETRTREALGAEIRKRRERDREAAEMRKRRDRETEGAEIRKRGIKVQLLEAFWSMVSPLNQHHVLCVEGLVREGLFDILLLYLDSRHGRAVEEEDVLALQLYERLMSRILEMAENRLSGSAMTQTVDMMLQACPPASGSLRACVLDVLYTCMLTQALLSSLQ
jgi:hypothetical protein